MSAARLRHIKRELEREAMLLASGERKRASTQDKIEAKIGAKIDEERQSAYFVFEWDDDDPESTQSACSACGDRRAESHNDTNEQSITEQEADVVAIEDVAMSGMDANVAQFQQLDSDYCPATETMELSPAKISLPHQHGATTDAQVPQAHDAQLPQAHDAMRQQATFCAETTATRLNYDKRTSSLTAGQHYASLAPGMRPGILSMARELAASS